MSEPLQCVPLGLVPSFGFGDRTGLATPGHVRAMQKYGAGIAPIFPQQSIRELTRTGRTAEQVMQEALDGAQAAGWTGLVGADADHLKTVEDVNITAAAGFTFFTIDPSADVDQHADDYRAQELQEKFALIQEATPWTSDYAGRSVTLSTGTKIDFSEEVCMRAAVKYGAAIRAALKMTQQIQHMTGSAGREHEIELSVDETEQPTTLAEHYIIAEQCLQAGMQLISLAPRFIGDFEKGVDYKGDLAAFEASLADHAAIAEQLGPYKISLHSGSDKLSLYGMLARLTHGRFHVKTSGTSYLEALRVVARHETEMFRDLIRFARERYNADKATYHVSATLESVPDEVGRTPAELETLYLDSWDDVPEGKGFTQPGRQILHCTFGSTLSHPTFGPALRRTLEANPQTYSDVLADHLGRHLQALQAGL